MGIEFPDEVQAGGIIGVVELVACVREHHSPWAMDDRYHWLLKNPRSLPFVPMRGRLGIFKVEIEPSRSGYVPRGVQM